MAEKGSSTYLLGSSERAPQGRFENGGSVPYILEPGDLKYGMDLAPALVFGADF